MTEAQKRVLEAMAEGAEMVLEIYNMEPWSHTSLKGKTISETTFNSLLRDFWIEWCAGDREGSVIIYWYRITSAGRNALEESDNATA